MCNPWAHVYYIAVILTFCAGDSVRKLVIEGWITCEDKIEILADMLENPEVSTSVFVAIIAIPAADGPQN